MILKQAFWKHNLKNHNKIIDKILVWQLRYWSKNTFSMQITKINLQWTKVVEGLNFIFNGLNFFFFFWSDE